MDTNPRLFYHPWNPSSAAPASTSSSSSALLRAYGPSGNYPHGATADQQCNPLPIHYSLPLHQSNSSSSSSYHIRATFNNVQPPVPLPPPVPPKPPRQQNTFMNTAALGQSDLGLTSLMSNLPDSASNSTVLSRLSSTNNQPHQCTVCDEAQTALAFCRDCSDYLCSACEEAHGRVRLTKRHHLDRIDVSASSETKREERSRKSSLVDAPFANLSYFCRAHSEECHYWCHTCARPCCDSCLREQGHHAEHDTQRRVNCDQDDQTRLNARRNELQARRDEVEAQMGQLAQLLDATKNTISDKYNKLLSKLTGERDRLYGELNLIRTSAMERYQLERQKLDEYEEQLIEKSDEKLPSSQMPQIKLNLADLTECLIGTITTSLVTSNTKALGTGLEWVNVPVHAEDWAEFVIYPRGWLNEPVGAGDLVVDIHPEPARVVYEKGHGYYGVKYMAKARCDHEIKITHKDDDNTIGTWRVKQREQKRDYKHDMRRVAIGRAGSGSNGEFKRPWGVCALPGGGVAISDRANNRLQLINSDMEVVLIYPEQSDSDIFNRPAGIAFSLKPEPTLIVADKDNHQIQLFHFSYNQLRLKLKFGSKGTAPGHFEYPWDVAVNSRGQIACADSRNHRIQLFAPSGSFISQYGFGGASPAPLKHFDYPRGLCFDRQDQLYATDFNLHRVLVINAQFTEAKFIGSQGTQPGRFHRPQGIAIDHSGRVIVADTKNKRIQVFNPDFTYLLEYSKLERPAGLCVTTNGRLAIVEEDELTSQIILL